MGATGASLDELNDSKNVSYEVSTYHYTDNYQ